MRLSKCWRGLQSSWRGQRIWFQNTSLSRSLAVLCWLMAGGLRALLHGPLHRDASVSSGHGSWHPPELGCRQVRAEVTMSFIVQPQKSHFLFSSLPQYPTGLLRSALFNVEGQDTRVLIPGGQDHWGHFGAWLPQLCGLTTDLIFFSGYRSQFYALYIYFRKFLFISKFQFFHNIFISILL